MISKPKRLILTGLAGVAPGLGGMDLGLKTAHQAMENQDLARICDCETRQDLDHQ
jgi:hypothetical protein